MHTSCIYTTYRLHTHSRLLHILFICDAYTINIYYIHILDIQKGTTYIYYIPTRYIYCIHHSSTHIYYLCNSLVLHMKNSFQNRDKDHFKKWACIAKAKFIGCLLEESFSPTYICIHRYIFMMHSSPKHDL